VRCRVLQCIALHVLAAFLSLVCCFFFQVCILQCVAVCCSVLQCVAVCCKSVVAYCRVLPFSLLSAGSSFRFMCWSVLQCVAMFCSVLQCVAVCCSVLPYCEVRRTPVVVVCCTLRACLLQRVAACCSVLQCVEVCCSML